jgi:hypothetical protein
MPQLPPQSQDDMDYDNSSDDEPKILNEEISKEIAIPAASQA